jgi:putative ABC transport system permease protein
MTTLWQDVRYGMRMLARSPGLAATAALCLGLGIGAPTMIFSVIYGALLRPFPYEKPEELVRLWEEKSTRPQYAQYKAISAPNFRDCRDSARAFQGMALVSSRSQPVRYRDKLESVRVLTVTSNFLKLLGAVPVLGRDFLPEEDLEGRRQVAILTDACWRSWFQSDPNVVGQSVLLRSPRGQEQSYSIIGVLPPEFFLRPFDSTADILIPAQFSSNDEYRGEPRWSALGRLAAGVTLRQAETELDLLTQRLREQYPKENEGFRLRAGAFRADYCSEGRVLYLLLGASGLLLVVACANMANLLLIRGLQRGKEITIRATLGAGRLRVLRQLVLEGLLVALLGLVAGLLVSFWGLAALRPSVLARVNVVGDINLDVRVLAFAAVLALTTGAVFGLLPAAQAWKMDLSTALRGDATQATTSVRTRRTYRLLVAGQIALAFILVVGAALAVQTFANLLRADPGFNPHQVLALMVEPPRYDGKRVVTFQQELVSRVEQLPGVVSAAVSPWTLPMWNPGGRRFLFDLEDRPAPSPEGYEASGSEIGVGYFRTLGVPLLLGRDFRDTDLDQPVVLVNRTLAQRFWPSASPLGQRLKSKEDGLSYEVIGVVGDECYTRDQLTGKQEIAPRVYLHNYRPGIFNLMIRTAANPLDLGPAVRALVKQMDDQNLVRYVRAMDDDVHGRFKSEQLTTLLVGVFAVFAFSLSVVGLYGVMAHSTRSRFREIAIRMATGARPADILGMILKQGVIVVAAGLGAGLAGVFVLARVAASYVYGVTPMDGLTLAGAVLLLGLASAAACFLPARRAAKIDPMAALRYE